MITLAFSTLDEKPTSILEVWEVSSGTKLQTIRFHDLFSDRRLGTFGWVQFSAAGDAVLAGGGDGLLKIPFRDRSLIEDEKRWAEADQKVVGTLSNTQKPIAMAPVGNWFLLASNSGLRRWDGQTLQPLTTYQESNLIMRRCRISDDARRVAFQWGKHVKVWDAQAGQLCKTLVNPSIVKDLQFSPQGDQLVTSCGDGIVRFWRIDDARPFNNQDLESVITRITGLKLTNNGDDLEKVDVAANEGLPDVDEAGDRLIDLAMERGYEEEWESARYLLTERIRQNPHDWLAFLLRAQTNFQLKSQAATTSDVERAVAEARQADNMERLLLWAECCLVDPALNEIVANRSQPE